MSQTQILTCQCGAVELAVHDKPIISAECCCNSCRTGSGKIEALQSAPELLTPYGATRYELYRKDRIETLKGEEHLGDFRLKPDAPTRRVVATCCNTPVYLEFRHGHWLSIYGAMWPKEALPPLELRTMTKDAPDPSALPNDNVPNAKTQSFGFMAKLLGAWAAMGFKTPKIPAHPALEL